MGEQREWLGSVRGRPIGPVRSFDGTALHVEEAGRGPTVVLAHGFCLGIASWHYQIRDLATDARLVLYDQRGHGLSSTPATPDFSMETLARDLDAVIDATAGDEPVVLVGHSMGGMVILGYAAMFPDAIGDRVSAVALVDTSCSDVVGGMLPDAAKLATPAVRLLEEAVVRAAGSNTDRFQRVRESRKDLVSMMLKLMGFGPKAPRHQVAFVSSLLASTPPDVLVWVFETLRKMDVSKGLDAIDVPSLMIVGSRDRITPPACARHIATSIHGCELAVIRGAGHMPMLEKPDVFNARLRSFLARPGAAYGGRRIGH